MAKKKTTKKRTTKKTTKAKSNVEVKPRTKSQVLSAIADDTGLTKKDVASVFDSMSGLIKKDLGRRGPGQFTVPGLMKIKRRHVPRKPARKNVWVPLVQEFRDIPAKPARTTVKVTPLKGLKDMV